MNRILPLNFEKHWHNPAGLIQVVIGPRQVGKTTALTTKMKVGVSIYASADLPAPPTTQFIVEHWERVRELNNSHKEPVILILDEIQKIPRWSEVVKKLWDEDQQSKAAIQVWLLGSSALLIEKGLSESLTGRFEITYFPHWIFRECEQIFNISIDDYIRLGGYPGAYRFKEDLERGTEYLRNSIIEPTLGRDILTLHAIDKPALLRQLFWYVSKLPAQVVSFEKILGHLQGKGNSATLVHYAELLSMAFLVKPIPKFSMTSHRTKRSTPKWILPNPALVDPDLTAKGNKDFVFENLIGSHFANLIFGNHNYELKYWREDNQEIDFIITNNNVATLAVEVKSGRVKKIPSRSTLEKRGIKCPFLVVHPGNLTAFLSTTSLAEVESLVKL